MEEKQILCTIKEAPEEGNQKNDLKKKEGLPLTKYIHHQKFKETLNENYRDTIIKRK